MTTLVWVLGLVVAVAAAVRSTWSPCGRSMLSTITPIGERGRGHRFAATASWFVVGGVLGGACLGGLAAGSAAALAAVHAPPAALGWAALAALLAGTALDAGLGGLRLPIHRRQVNERWLDRYRSGVYGLGFGWQIGCGLATYITTAGVYLVVVLGCLTARPWEALALGVLFGTVRGLAVLAGRGLRSPVRLAVFHRRLDELGDRSRRTMVAVEAAVAVALAAVLWLPAGAMVAVAVAVAALGPALARVRRRPVTAVATAAHPSP